MSRAKVYAEQSTTVATDARKSSGSAAARRLIQLAPAHGAAHAPPPKKATAQARVNMSPESAVAVIVPSGGSIAQASLDVVGPGGSVTAPAGSRVAGFIHADGTAVQFLGESGVHLSAALANREFGAVMAAARRLLHVAPAATPKAIHRRAESSTPVGNTNAVDAAIKSSSGAPLPARTRSRLESSFGASLSSVRVHTDASADQAAASVQARAFTTGQDVYFRAGQYQPGSAAGDHLIAHEVAHTVQQGNGASGMARMPEQADWQVSQPGDRHEREAEKAADAAAYNRPATLSSLSGAPLSRLVSRRTDAGSAPDAKAGPASAATPAPVTTGPKPPAATGPSPESARSSAKQAPTGKAAPTSEPRGATAEPPAGKAAAPGPAKVPAGADKGAASDKAVPNTGESGKGDPEKSGGEKAVAGKGAEGQGDKGKAGGDPTAAGGGGGKPGPGGKGPAGKGKSAAPAAGAGLAAVAADVSSAGKDQKSHPSVADAAGSTLKATDLTPEEAADRARGDQVGQMASKEKGVFNRAAFKASLKEKIEKLQADDSKNIKDEDKAEAINSTVKSGVAAEKQAAAGEINQAAQQPPAKGEPKPGDKLPEPPKAKAPQVDGTRAVPAPVPEERRSMESESQAIDQQMASAEVTPEQLRRANDPAFSAAADAQANARNEAAAAPERTQQAESKILDDSRGKADQTVQSGLGEMQGQRADKLAGSLEEQKSGKANYEAARKRVAEQLGKIYEDTKKSVDERLAKLDKDVAQTFDDGAASAKRSFYVYLGANLLAYYLGGGWIANAFTGGKTKEKIFEDGRRKYLEEMEQVIDKVADVVELGLNDVVAIIKSGRDQLAAAVQKFGPEDKAVAEEVATGLQDKFASLEKSVEDKQTELIDSLAKKYVAAQKDVDSVIDAIRNPVGALISAAVGMLAGVIETILKMKAMLMSALAKAREAIGLIIADPIGFLGNLVAGVKAGVEGFVSNIGSHLQKGLLAWLFGAVAEAGIQLPDKFDLSGLLSIVLQVLGLTWTNIRKRAVAIVGENVVKALETGSQIIMTLVTKGAAGLWEFIKEQAASILETLKESVKSFVIESVIVAGVKWLIGLLNPASAFVKACMAIYDIIMFIINRGQQILAFVNAVLDSVLSIAKGAIAPAAKAVESALAKSIPVAIGFLASLLGIGDLGGKLKKVIDKIQEPINKVIDWLIKKAVGLVKAVGKLFGVGKDDSPDKKAGNEIHVGTTMDGESHELYVKEEGDDLSIEMASRRRTAIRGLVVEAIAKEKKREKARPDVIADLEGILEDIAQIRQEWITARKASTAKSGNSDLTAIAKRLEKVAARLRKLGDEHKIKELQQIGMQKSQYVEGGKLLADFAADVRKHFYPRSWAPGVIAWRDQYIQNRRVLKKTGLKARQGHFFDVNERETPMSKADIDHDPPLVSRWNAGGNNTTQERRNADYNDLRGDKLQVMHESDNRGKDSGKKYVAEVGEHFRGPKDV